MYTALTFAKNCVNSILPKYSYLGIYVPRSQFFVLKATHADVCEQKVTKAAKSQNLQKDCKEP